MIAYIKDFGCNSPPVSIFLSVSETSRAHKTSEFIAHFALCGWRDARGLLLGIVCGFDTLGELRKPKQPLERAIYIDVGFMWSSSFGRTGGMVCLQ